jgi:hypothetical protein
MDPKSLSCLSAGSYRASTKVASNRELGPIIRRAYRRYRTRAPALELQRFFDGSFLRFVFAKSLSCFSDIDFSICFEAPLRLDFGRFPRFAANAAPAAICCFFDLAGIFLFRWPM